MLFSRISQRADARGAAEENDGTKRGTYAIRPEAMRGGGFGGSRKGERAAGEEHAGKAAEETVPPSASAGGARKKWLLTKSGVGVWQQEIEHELIRDMSWPQSMGIPALFAGAL